MLTAVFRVLKCLIFLKCRKICWKMPYQALDITLYVLLYERRLSIHRQPSKIPDKLIFIFDNVLVFDGIMSTFRHFPGHTIVGEGISQDEFYDLLPLFTNFKLINLRYFCSFETTMLWCFKKILNDIRVCI